MTYDGLYAGACPEFVAAIVECLLRKYSVTSTVTKADDTYTILTMEVQKIYL